MQSNHNHHHHHQTHEQQGSEEHDNHAGHNPAVFKQKFWVSLMLTIPALLFSHTLQSWFGVDLSFYGSEYISAVFGVVIFFYGGSVFIKSAKEEISSRRPGMMTLVSMAITIAFLYSSLVTLGYVDGMDFWWELATLVTIMLLGHWLEMASVHKAQGALHELAKLIPDEAEVVTGGKRNTVPVAQLKVGDKVFVRPGGYIPIDGKITKGTSEINESMLTGESQLVKKTIHEQVIGGTVNMSSALTIEVTESEENTVLAGIMRVVHDAQISKSKAQVLADKAAFWLTFVAISAALLTWVGWWLAGAQAGFIFERVVTVLVIACPHALGLAIPLVTSIATTRAAKNGLLVRERMALESARNIDVVLFDKTGTLTKGEQGVIEVVAEDSRRAISLAAAIERESEHSIARAIVEYADKQNTPVVHAAHFTALAGYGVQAKIKGKTVHVGGPRLLEKLHLKLGAELKSTTDTAIADGKTVVYVVESKQILAAIILADTIRTTSKAAVATLQGMGKRVAIITGDNEGVAAWVAKELNISEYFADVLPELKAQVVRQIQADGSKVAMVGDGINDAPALVQADVGIAIGAGTDVAIESAGIVLASSDPSGVAKIFTLSRQTYRKMVQNLIWATGYNILALLLAAGVTYGAGFVLSPAVGAVLMSLSTIIVAVNAQLLRRTKL